MFKKIITWVISGIKIFAEIGAVIFLIYIGLTGSYISPLGLETAAKKGDAIAQFELGQKYSRDHNYEQAFVWYKKAAEQGHAKAQHCLGECYEDGTGVEEDPKQAFAWYQKAAEQGLAEAQYDLGRCYCDGIGVAKDHKQAIHWISKAAGKHFAPAITVQGDWDINGEAAEYYRKAAVRGDAIAQFNLGWCYEFGKGVEKDLGRANYWYRRAATNNTYYETCPRNKVRLKSAELGMARVRYKLGVKAEKDNPERAAKLYHSSAALGYEPAKEALKRLGYY